MKRKRTAKKHSARKSATACAEQTAPSTPTVSQPVSKAQAQGEGVAMAGKDARSSYEIHGTDSGRIERPMAMSPGVAAPYFAESHNILHARSQDAVIDLRRASMNHATAVARFQQTDLSDYSALNRATDDLSSARHTLIGAHKRVLDLNRSNG